MKTPREIIRDVKAWQSNDSVHPLTCSNDSSHSKLVPINHGGKVRLECPDCDYVQDYIPGIVLKEYREGLEE